MSEKILDENTSMKDERKRIKIRKRKKEEEKEQVRDQDHHRDESAMGTEKVLSEESAVHARDEVRSEDVSERTNVDLRTWEINGDFLEGGVKSELNKYDALEERHGNVFQKNKMGSGSSDSTGGIYGKSQDESSLNTMKEQEEEGESLSGRSEELSIYREPEDETCAEAEEIYSQGVSKSRRNMEREVEHEVTGELEEADETKRVEFDAEKHEDVVREVVDEEGSPTEDEEKAKKPRPPKKRSIPPRLKELVEVDEKNERYILLNEISAKTISELIKLSYDLEIQNPTSLKRQELITEIMKTSYNDYGIKLYAEGIFQQIDSGVGFLRLAHNNYLQSSDDVFVSKQIIKKYGLRSGDVVFGEIRPPEDDNKGKYFSLQNVISINYSETWKSKERMLFENLIPYYPTKKFNLDIQFDGDVSCRVVDIIAPIGKGQRGLIVSPPRAGKTMLMQNLARSILTNHPEVIMIILLIDERPEEVTDWKKNILSKFKDRNIEVVAATFDEKPDTHIKVAEITLAKAKRLVEYKYDVVIFLDSITRLTRAYNQYIPSSGKVLTGGIDSAALQFPKKFFGAARSIEGGGSLTIIATCLIDTGSRMDEVIFEEFKGTGNMEIYLDRRIAERRIFPAIDVHRSGTRKEELLIYPENLPKIWLLRKVLQPMSTVDAMELLYEKISQTKDNESFFNLIVSGA